MNRGGDSLFEFIAAAIDEVLPADSPLTGREVYLRGFERFEELHFRKMMASKRRQLESAMPLLAANQEEMTRP